MRRLRVTLVVPGFPRTEDEPGMPAVLDLVGRLSADVDVRVVALRYPPRGWYDLVGVPVRALGLAGSRGPVGRARVLAAGVRTIAGRRPGPDLVHGLWADEAGAVAVLAARLIRRPSVVSVMGGELVAMPDIRYGAALGRGGRWTVATALRLADLATAGSTPVLEVVASRRGERPVALRPLGVDTARFAPPAAGEGPDGPSILFVGSLEPVKDLELLLRAAGELPGSPRITVAGDGSLRPALERLAADLGLGGRVRFLGQVPRVVLPALYRATTVLAVTSRHEGQSMVAVEAAACGVPVVGPPVGVLPDLGGGAHLVPPGNAGALADGLAAILDDPARRAAMAAAARAAAVGRFEIARTSAALLADYERLAAR